MLNKSNVFRNNYKTDVKTKKAIEITLRNSNINTQKARFQLAGSQKDKTSAKRKEESI